MSDTDVMQSTQANADRWERKGKRVGPYSMSEKRALAELVTRTRNSLRNIPTQMSPEQYKQIWVDISNCMHANGWPKRSWRRLRLKAQQMLTTSIENGSVGVTLNTPVSQSDCCPNMCVGVTLSAVSQSSASESLSSSLVSTPPPLLSSSEASAETVMRLSNVMRLPTEVPKSTGDNVNGATNSLTSGPQILHVCSRAVTQADHTNGLPPAKQTNVCTTPAAPTTADGSTVLEVLDDDFINGGDRIELLVSSDDESEDPCSTHPSLEKDTSVQQDISAVNSQSTVGIQESPPLPEPIGSLTQADFRKRMEIYELKLEVLKLKRAYWTQKLRSL